jgi:mRNA-degrading endonuclease YafQ of YafQ-DinJ toxin-antitoxin module
MRVSRSDPLLGRWGPKSPCDTLLTEHCHVTVDWVLIF